MQIRLKNAESVRVKLPAEFVFKDERLDWIGAEKAAQIAAPAHKISALRLRKPVAVPSRSLRNKTRAQNIGLQNRNLPTQFYVIAKTFAVKVLTSLVKIVKRKIFEKRSNIRKEKAFKLSFVPDSEIIQIHQ